MVLPVTDPGIFDSYAGDYDSVVNASISASGEQVEFFVELKTQLMRQALEGYTPATVLDFGCGTGNATRALSAAYPAASVIGFDPSRESIAMAQRLSRDVPGEVRFITSDRSRIPFSEGELELAFTSCVFHHIEESRHLLWARELLRVLKPAAPLFLFEHNPYNPLTRRVVRACPFDRGVKLLRPRYAVRFLTEAGFTVGRPRYYFFFPRALSLLRPIEAYLRWLPLGAQYFVVARRPA